MKLLKISIIFLLFGQATLFSDNRHFVWTYEYVTMEEGASELEQYMTYKGLEKFESAGERELNLEFEFGMSEGFDFAIYQNFKQKAGGDFLWDGFKARFRKKLGKENAWWFSPLLYLEYISKDASTLHKFEVKLILERKFGDFTLAINPYFEYEQEQESETLIENGIESTRVGEKKWEFTPKYSLGLNYEMGRLLSFGIEAKGGENGHYFGPTISHGEHDMWVSFGYLFGAGLDKGKPEQMARLIFGIEINSPNEHDDEHEK